MKEGTGELSVTAITVIIVLAVLAIGSAVMVAVEKILPGAIEGWFKGIFEGIQGEVTFPTPGV